MALAVIGGAGELEAAPRLPDAALALVLLVVGQLDLRFNLDNSTHYGPGFAGAVVVAVAALALAWRRRWPLATLCVVAAAIAGPDLTEPLTFTLWGHFVPLLVVTYSVARWAPRRHAVIGAGVVAVAITVVFLRVPAAGEAGNIPFAIVPAVAVFVTGLALRRRHERAVELTDRARRLEADQEANVAAALAEERARIARELHDVVAHCVSVMVVQAGSAEALLEISPDRAREPLREVQRTGQRAIVELTRMLALLRVKAEGESRELAPQPGIAQLPELAERLSSSGLAVSLTTTGEPWELAPGVDLTAFRIVQEALTNTLKHAGPGALARVSIRFLQQCLEVEVTDDGTCTTPDRRGGHGLIGMAERVSIFGGALETGRCPDGGFRVLASLPLDTS